MAISDRRSATLALAHALSAAERGLPVIPLSATKLPALPSPHRSDPHPVACHGECGRPGHGVHDATTDLAAVRALFAAAPWATGYGIACGRSPHHLIGVDLDVKHGGAPTDVTAELRHLALEHLFTLPPTVTVLTPSGGRHLWLTGPPDVAVPNSASRLAPGIDIRGAGGYLVGPGSVTARGAYRLAPGSEHLDPAPCPRTLLTLIAPPAPPARPHAANGRADGRGLVQFVRTAHEGQRNTRLFWAACRAYENGLGDSLAEALTAAAVHTGLTEHEARTTILSAARLTTPPTDPHGPLQLRTQKRPPT
ncbi:bifunctional DNA primase/polymerase [Streptomyces sp. P9(2023)]|uniref:bifunctional DNA primase/polymerase n=1 Tax=Streptomyces sp. P9(2023) TaxID=3064394 RepID=UPI0028F41DF9|nr:bifunctional DNA primase/polymerase [Streptomyces sp. P9(2023)]MDT9693492.1 bifunctional DNA primase/polymerase [Streptomyces sp. P9(2023)]